MRFQRLLAALAIATVGLASSASAFDQHELDVKITSVEAFDYGPS